MSGGAAASYLRGSMSGLRAWRAGLGRFRVRRDNQQGMADLGEEPGKEIRGGGPLQAGQGDAGAGGRKRGGDLPYVGGGIDSHGFLNDVAGMSKG